MTKSSKPAKKSNRRATTRHKGPAPLDFPLLLIVVILLGLGLVMIFSASYVHASTSIGRSNYYLVRQLQWLVVGLGVMGVAAAIDYRYLQSISLWMMVGTMMLLLTVLVMGANNFGASRHLFGASVQPSEIGKLTIMIYIATWLTSKGERLRQVSYGLIPFAILLGLIALLLVLQPDFGTTVLVVATALIMFFIAGADTRQLFISLIVAAGTLYLAVTRVDYAYQRVTDYLAGLADPTAGSYQTTTGLQALAQGGVVGKGLGDGWAKGIGGVPFPWTDSIFTVVGEELGLVGALTVVALFMILTYRGLHIALNTKDPFGLVLGVGITAMISLQAFVNMAVNAAMLPFSGLTLPFISYGGSSLVATLASIGVLLSISRYGGANLATRRKSSSTGPSRDAPAGLAAFGFGRRERRPRLFHSVRARRPESPCQSAAQRALPSCASCQPPTRR